MVAQGYQSKHLIVTQEGKVIFDPEAVEGDAFKLALQKDKAKQEFERMVQLGYKPEHLIQMPDGQIQFDPEAVELDAFQQALQQDKNKKQL